MFRAVEPPHGATWCFAIDACYESGTKVALLTECHLAMGFAAATFQRVKILRMLHRNLFLVVPLGLLIGGIQVYVAGEFWSSTGAVVCKHKHFDTVYTIFVPVILSICLPCYVCSGIRVRCAGGEVAERRTWRHGHLYVFVAISTILPSYLFGQGQIFPQTPSSYIVSGSLANLRGFLNAAVYARDRRAISRQITTLANDHRNSANRGDHGGVRFTVQFHDPSVVEVTPVATWSTHVSVIVAEDEYGLVEILGCLLLEP